MKHCHQWTYTDFTTLKAMVNMRMESWILLTDSDIRLMVHSLFYCYTEEFDSLIKNPALWGRPAFGTALGTPTLHTGVPALKSQLCPLSSFLLPYTLYTPAGDRSLCKCVDPQSPWDSPGLVSSYCFSLAQLQLL